MNFDEILEKQRALLESDMSIEEFMKEIQT